MRHHHVPIGTGRLVEADPGAERERLGHVDLDVVDVIAVPDGLEQAVGESEGEDVEGRFLPEEVVDAEDLLFGEGLVERRVQGARRGQVRPERLFHDDPGPVDEPGLAEGPHDGPGRGRRHAEVVEAPRLVAELAFGLAHRLGQPLRP